jgi:septal ring factor EnvC (AmiA/AmiB activator)
MDNRAQVQPESALISAVVAAAVAVAALAFAVAAQRRLGQMRRRIGSISAESARSVDRQTAALLTVRAELNRVQGQLALVSDRLDRSDAQLDAWTAGLARARVAATHLNERRLVPVTRLIRAVEIALQMAGLWRNPFG